jgi:hypothetical protein
MFLLILDLYEEEVLFEESPWNSTEVKAKIPETEFLELKVLFVRHFD